ncbi:Retrovirus Polyprotein [Phytophthora cinnamomi]|uniref:Retrovirus Polyprotein n=1 Tax=Phytophthora cinnamomi TaxID=4785 RepID=UPI0035598CC4|nr:Retrovirus Polyprotein [Phytophthora cinnamomi]
MSGYLGGRTTLSPRPLRPADAPSGQSQREDMTTARNDRAERRAASQERAAAATEAVKRQVASATLETDGGGVVTLDAAEIHLTTGNTPMNTGNVGSNDGAGGGNQMTSGGDQSEGRSGRVGSGGDSQRGHGPDATHGSDPTRTTAGRSADSTGPGGGRTPVTIGAGGNRGVDGTPQQPIVVREKAKSLKLTKFKGLDDAMPVTMWLKTVRAEVRRQAVTMGIIWQDKQLYHEMAAHLDGEAQRWFAAVMETVPENEESISTLANMLRAKYMTQRTSPEVVDLLNARRQMRGERLVDYAQALREIAERGDVGEDWLVNAFLKGMSSTKGATNVGGHRPQSLDEAVILAVPHVGEYGEGYGVGLETAMSRWDEREAAKKSQQPGRRALDHQPRKRTTGHVG